MLRRRHRCLLLALISVASVRPGIAAAQSVLSPDGKKAAFVRTVAGERIWTPLREVEPQEIWIVDADGAHARSIFSSIRGTGSADSVAGLEDLAFSADGRKLYFMNECAAVTACVNVVDLRTRRFRRLKPANRYRLLRHGAHAGDFLIERHRYSEGDSGGSYQEVWLMAANGKLIRPVGSGDDDFENTVERFIAADAR